MNASDILRKGLDVLEERGQQRDQPGGERSMPAVVQAFNALTGHELTEQQGWLLLALVKVKRSQTGKQDPDHYVDGANYVALAGEAALRDAVPPTKFAEDVEKILFNGKVICKNCNGTGRTGGWLDIGNTRYRVICKACDGSGLVTPAVV